VTVVFTVTTLGLSSGMAVLVIAGAAEQAPAARPFDVEGIRLGMRRPEVVAAAKRSGYSTNPEVGTEFRRPGAKPYQPDSPVISVKYYWTDAGLGPASSIRWSVNYSTPDPARGERL
jgi:hypothetical protein